MSGSVKLKLPAGGSKTISAPDSASDEVITLPAGTKTLADTSLSNLSATGEQLVAQAWVNFTGTGTVAIRDSYNVSSVTDNGTGQYAVNFTNDMANTDYCPLSMYNQHTSGAGSDNRWPLSAGARSVGSLDVYCSVVGNGYSYTDKEDCYLTIFGDPS